MKKILLNLYFLPTFIVITIVGLSLLPFILLVNVIFLGRGFSRSLRLAIRFYGWVLVCHVPFMAPVKVVGNIRKMPTPCIIIANHNSAIDPFLFGAIPIENCFVTSWPFKIPVYGLFMKLAGYINITDGWDNMRRQCINRLSEGSSVTIWPEGHRSRDGRLGRFRKGAFQLAVETGYPIQPVCIIGSADIMSPGEWLLSPGRVKLILLDPLFPDKHSMDPQLSTSELCQKSIAAIEKCREKYQDCQVITPDQYNSNIDGRSKIDSGTFTATP